MNKWVFRIIIVVVLGLVGFFGYRYFSGAGADSDTTGNNAPEYTTVFLGDLSAGATAAGQLIAQREADLVLQTTGVVALVNAKVGDLVTQGDLLVQLDIASLERSVLEAEQTLAVQEQNLAKLLLPAADYDILSAEASLASAQAALDDFLAGPSDTQIASSEASVNAARADLGSVQSRYSELAAGGPADEVITAEKSLADAEAAYKLAEEAHRSTFNCKWNETSGQFDCDPFSDDADARAAAQQALANLVAAQEQLSNLQPGSSNSNVVAQGATVATRRAALDAALARHEKLLAGATEEQIMAAEATLAQAQATLDNLQEGETESAITRQEVAVETARVGLERAQYTLAKATLLAPFNGVVTQVNVTPGEIGSGVVMSIIDMNSLEVVLDVDEVDIGTVSVGQEATVAFDAYQGVELVAKIVSIAPLNTTNNSGTINYEVNLAIEDSDLELLNGLTAEARLLTAKIEGVLLVTNQAIRANREDGTFFVDRVTGVDEDGNVILEEVEIQIGLRDNFNTQIIGGLDEGDEVAIGYVPPPEVEIRGGPGGPGGD
ncbi:MAG: HlyD family secretion protein [Cellvibrionaceae bacterium]|jgi:HlyD family secretion protein